MGRWEAKTRVAREAAYRGPMPARENLSAETVIIRAVSAQPSTGIQFFYVDRVQFIDDSPHHVDRVVEVTSRDIQAEVDQLALKVGDRVRISTQFIETRRVGGLRDVVPNWPGHTYYEYPIGFHVLTSVERLQAKAPARLLTTCGRGESMAAGGSPSVHG